MTVPNRPPYARELYIAQLAVQRASLATKKLLPDIAPEEPSFANSTKPPTIDEHSPPPRPGPSSANFTTPKSTPPRPLPPTLPQPRLIRTSSMAKQDKTPVTVADLAAQCLLIAALHSAFPNDLIVGEEDTSVLHANEVLRARVWELVRSTKLDDEELEKMLGARPRSEGEMMDVIELGANMIKNDAEWARAVGEEKRRVWCMDPVDGTSAYMQAGQYAVAGKGKKVELRDVHFVDSSGSPATLTEKVKELAEIVGARYPAQTELYASHMRYAAITLGGRECVQLRWPKKVGAAWSVWDHAGSQLIYTESGAGKVTDLAGNPIDFTAGKKLRKSWGLITADESIHDEIVRLVAEMMEKERRELEELQRLKALEAQKRPARQKAPEVKKGSEGEKGPNGAKGPEGQKGTEQKGRGRKRC
ncbi:hypothetical protein N0V88_006280 [Collariella sp. IMI 366227]|nr:hypothetical protein N0V88_006280 [Collariella sp. IMI 366227]